MLIYIRRHLVPFSAANDHSRRIKNVNENNNDSSIIIIGKLKIISHLFTIKNNVSFVTMDLSCWNWTTWHGCLCDASLYRVDESFDLYIL